jgi:hypothetical protein
LEKYIPNCINYQIIFQQGTRLYPVEIKSGRTITHEAYAGLDKWSTLAGENGGDESWQHKGIQVMGWRECGQLTD